MPSRVDDAMQIPGELMVQWKYQASWWCNANTSRVDDAMQIPVRVDGVMQILAELMMQCKYQPALMGEFIK